MLLLLLAYRVHNINLSYFNNCNPMFLFFTIPLI